MRSGIRILKCWAEKFQQGPWFARPAHPLQNVRTQSNIVIWINTVVGNQRQRNFLAQLLPCH